MGENKFEIIQKGDKDYVLPGPVSSVLTCWQHLVGAL